MAKKRSKYFATLAYSESCPNYLDCLNTLCIDYLVSPLHCSDVNSDGTPKKEHYHIILVFDSLKSCDQVRELISDFGFVGLEIVQSLRSYARYLCHLDNADKMQYSPDDVVCRGIDYQQFIKSDNDKYDIYARIIDYIRDKQVMSFYDLLVYARYNDFDMFRALCDNSYMIREFLRSAVDGARFVSQPNFDENFASVSDFDPANPFGVMATGVEIPPATTTKGGINNQ